MAEDSSGWHGATGCGLSLKDWESQLPGSPDLSALLFCCSAAEAWCGEGLDSVFK